MTAAPRIAMTTPLGGSPFYGHSESYQPEQPGGIIWAQPFDVERLRAKGCTDNTAMAADAPPVLSARADALAPRSKVEKAATTEQVAS